MILKQFKQRLKTQATARLERLLPVYRNTGPLRRFIEREIERRERENRLKTQSNGKESNSPENAKRFARRAGQTKG
jgi:hypothetical protein